MTVYSYSRINTFKNCPFQYKLQYIDKIKVEEEGIEAFMGSRIHETLEKLYADLIMSKTNTIEELLEYYDKCWSEKWHEKVVIVKSGFTAEDYKETGKRAVSDYYSHYYPFDQTKPLWTEKLILFDLGDDQYKMQGYIDRLDKKSNGALEIHDYKGSARLAGQNIVDNDKQLGLYQLAVQEQFPDAECIHLVWHYVLFDTELRSDRTPEQLEELKAEFRGLIDEIENTKEFKPNKSPLCNWCGYQEYCPAKKRFVTLDDFDFL
jgi:RecB family exonuclease